MYGRLGDNTPAEVHSHVQGGSDQAKGNLCFLQTACHCFDQAATPACARPDQSTAMLVCRLVIGANGAAYAAASARKGVLPRLLSEILATRVMVKAAMKAASPKARVLQRQLNARQFGLKLIANVSYGYAAAGFSGRMPMAELADSIVQVGTDSAGEACIQQQLPIANYLLAPFSPAYATAQIP